MTTKLSSLFSEPFGRKAFSADSVGLYFFPAVLALWCGLIAVNQVTAYGGKPAALPSAPATEVPTGSIAKLDNSTTAASLGLSDQAPKGQQSAALMDTANDASAPPPVIPSGRSLVLAGGDLLKIAVYERLIIDEDKWSSASERTKPSSASLQLRSEMTGDYSVQEDGTISLPILGAFEARDRTLDELRNDVAKSYAKTLGRQSIVDVRLSDRLPIYVLGPVKNSGLYKFSAGMTVWHGVALAGGFEQSQRRPEYYGNRLEATRETGTYQLNGDRVASLIARREILVAQREKRAVSTPVELRDLSGREAADRLIANEVSARKLVIEAQAASEVSSRADLAAATSELEASRQRIEFIERTIKQQEERLTGLRVLGLSGNVRRPQLLEAEMQLSQTQERREEARVGSARAEQKINQAKQELARLSSVASLDVENQISAIEREIGDVKGQRKTGQRVLDELKTADQSNEVGPYDLDQLAKYEIVRRSGDQAITIPAKGDTELRPGDLVKLTVSRPQPALR